MEKPVVFKNCGEQIIGILHIPEKRHKKTPGILLCHGLTGQKSGSHFILTKLARKLCEKNIVVLRFDFRGSGDSEGKFENMTLETEMSDGEKALNFLCKQPQVNKEKIGILGLSMGTITAVYLSSKNPNVKALCLWSPLAYPSLARNKVLTKKMKEKIAKTGKAYTPGGHYLGKNFFKNLSEIKPLKFAEKFTGAVLIIHARDDITLPLNHPLAYFKYFHRETSSCEMIILENGGHTFATEFSEKKVLSETVKFMNKCLF